MKFIANSIVVALLAAALSCSPASAAGLGVGDTAPPLSIIEWVKGASVDLKRDARKKIHMVEFWATWCPPCKMSVPLLSELQKKYKKDLVIIGVTEPDMRGNTPAAIRAFVKQQGAIMDYTVAIDDGRTTEAYLVGAGVIGIPHAFIVDRNGKIVWQGSPLEPNLDDVLGRIVAGEYDLQAAKMEREVNKRFEELNFMAQMGRWKVVWDGLIEILRLDPANELAMSALRDIAIQETEDRKRFEAWVRSHIKTNRANARAMRQLATTLTSIGDLGSRFPELALEAAKASYTASKQREATAVAAYARALYQIGNLDRAIALQQDAVALADTDGRAEIKSGLDYYRRCKKLQTTEQ